MTSSITADQAARLLSSFSSFLTVAIHSLLYHRALYPTTSFLTSRAYNLSVHQSRHPGVCTWVTDAVAAVTAQIRTGTARAVVLSIHAPQSMTVLERWVFDLQSFPASWGDATDEREGGGGGDLHAAPVIDQLSVGPSAVGAAPVVMEEVEDQLAEGEDDLNWTDVNEALRGALQRLAYAAEKSPPLPARCTFTLAMELREESLAPIGHPQPWIPAEHKDGSEPRQRDLATAPIRSVRAGPLFFECWLEKKYPTQDRKSA
ncbi:hypothetical protein NQ176_g4705 [Zarea fungicola]|uniref:Uncharacterized protein n=1 Tax=Zarea fungicola TaxID=93591 RepID=A0ACC1NEL9_9HYPO|nr:hypothetical protein NQ176_g4705 [Lecanicillium fungicola]